MLSCVKTGLRMKVQRAVRWNCGQDRWAGRIDGTGTGRIAVLALCLFPLVGFLLKDLS